jgi:hypothetical protein
MGEGGDLSAASDLTFAEKFPESTYFLDGVEVHCTGPDHDAVMWMSDWGRWMDLVDAGLLRADYGGPGTYGHISLYVIRQAEIR